MSYEYGSSSLGIKNPFKVEGKILIITGSLISLVGMYLLFSVSGDLKASAILGWKDVSVGVMILLWGFGSIGLGILKVTRFYVGRNAPSSLAKNLNPVEATRENAYYNSETLESMLVGRKNTTFEEPSNLVQRILYTVMPNLLFTPPPVYKLLIEITVYLIKMISAFFIFSIVYFIANIGLMGEFGMKLNSILSFIFLSALAYYLFDLSRTLHNIQILSKLKMWVGSTILVIFGLIMVNSIGEKGLELQPVYFNAWPSMIIYLALTIVISTLALIIIKERGYGQTKTEVSEYREYIQESIHPKEVMIHLESIILANRRYKEIPNRLYQKLDGKLQSENDVKGHFATKTMIETQPEFIETENTTHFGKIRLATTIIAQSFIVISAILIAWLGHVIIAEGIESSLSKILTILFAALALYTSGSVLERLSHMFWSELRFKSLLLWMKLDGTFTESKISTGMAVYDSTRSENTLVRSSITNWLVCSRVTTTTFVESGSDNVEGSRYVYEMEKDEHEAQSIVSELRSFMSTRENIAKMSQKDSINVSEIKSVNQSSKEEFATEFVEPKQIAIASESNDDTN
ncbi:MAG: hypothetical protein WC680_08715 [Sulfuricurvum sp.]|jgi:hypothetical protein